MVSAFLAALSASLALRPVLGAIYTDPSVLPKTQYDYVVVGGPYLLPFSCRRQTAHVEVFAAGIGGGVVASRLAEVPGNKVLLIEAGFRYAHFSRNCCADSRGRTSSRVDPSIQPRRD